MLVILAVVHDLCSEAVKKIVTLFYVVLICNILQQVGEMISLIDMPSIHECNWWRGKRKYEVCSTL
jgi:hypothetical protein